MDGNQLRKKLSTYQSNKGQFRNVSEEILFEVLNAWEEWPGTAKGFYKSIGFSQRKMAELIGKAKFFLAHGNSPLNLLRLYELLPKMESLQLNRVQMVTSHKR